MEVRSTLAESAQCCGSRAKYTSVEKSKTTHRFSVTLSFAPKRSSDSEVKKEALLFCNSESA